MMGRANTQLFQLAVSVKGRKETMTTIQKMKSVVTPARYEQGISWSEWMDTIDRNKDKFAENYEGFEPDPADIAAITGLVNRGASKCLALGEAWCTDVVRGLPVMA